MMTVGEGHENVTKKKHTGLKVLGIIFIILIVLFVIVFALLMFLPDDSDKQAVYSSDYEETALTDLVSKLSQGGKSPCSDYDGENGIWGTAGIDDSGELRAPYTDTSKAQTVTWMVYIVGANLESEDGAASADIQEMLDSKNGSDLNVVIQTGGATKWDNGNISADTRQRWLIQNGEMSLCEDIGQDSMCTESSLSDFVSWSAETYPADRYILTLWDHGGGTLGGYGSDENYPEDGLDLAEMAGSVADSGIKLDIVSFDACLMGTMETAYTFSQYADYLIASEETEPGDGWYYTDTMKALSDDPAMSSEELGARLIDDYGDYYANTGVTLSLIDLRVIPKLYKACTSYYQSADQELTEQQGFTQLSSARSGSRSYADGEYEQVDLADYVQRTDVSGGEDVVRALFEAVRYRNKSDLTGSYGLATYFPYTSPEEYADVISDLTQVGCNGAEDFYDSFLSILASGTGGNENGVTSLTGYEEETLDFGDESWYTSDAGQGFDFDTIDNTDELTLDYSDKDEAYVLSLADDTWDDIEDIQLQVMIDDGEGYLDLGSDQLCDVTDDGSLIVDFDSTWTLIDGMPVAYYADKPQENGDLTIYTGKVPAELNGEEDIDICIKWQLDSDGNGTAEVLGYLPQDNGQTLPKGYLTLKSGDEIRFLCDYYTYDGDYDDSYYIGDPITVTSQDDLQVELGDLGDSKAVCWVCLTDVYRQDWYTETVEVTNGTEE